MALRYVFVGALALCLTLLGALAVASGDRPSRRGDINDSGDVDISDVIFFLQFLFRGGDAPICVPVADVNSDGGSDIGDAVYLLGVIFRGQGDLEPLGVEESAVCDQGRVVKCGEDSFSAPDPLGNLFSCAHCHGTGPATGGVLPDGPVLPAHGLGDAAARSSWFGGEILDLPSAINRCRSDWMAAPPLADEDPAIVAQVAFLESLASGIDAAPVLGFDIVPPATSGASIGDPVEGCETFTRTCAGCHGELGATNALAPSLWARPLSADAIRQQIRLSGPTADTVPGTLYDGLLGNRMPFWSAQRLGDAQIEDIVAYLGVATDPARRPCDQVEDRPPGIERAGTFFTYSHGVRGAVEQWSDRRIRLRGFYFDGRGPEDVVVWLYDKDPRDFHAILRGTAISGHMGRAIPYRGVDLEFAIPESLEDGDYDTVSIWCTAFQSNYGEADLSD